MDFYRVEVADRQEVQTWIDAVVEKYGRIDVPVNNAGVLRDGLLVAMKNGEVINKYVKPSGIW